jgi:hypothetical protein
MSKTATAGRERNLSHSWPVPSPKLSGVLLETAITIAHVDVRHARNQREHEAAMYHLAQLQAQRVPR